MIIPVYGLLSWSFPSILNSTILKSTAYVWRPYLGSKFLAYNFPVIARQVTYIVQTRTAECRKSRGILMILFLLCADGVFTGMLLRCVGWPHLLGSDGSIPAAVHISSTL